MGIPIGQRLARINPRPASDRGTPTRRQNGPPRKGKPVSPLQAARLERGWIQPVAVARFREVCPGHRGVPCRTSEKEMSMWENGRRTPSLRHVAALCRLYQQSPESLGLVVWRGMEAMEPQDQKARAWLREHLRREVRDEVREELRAEVRDEVRELLRGEVRAEVRREVAEEILAAVAAYVRGLGDGDSPTV